MQINVDKMREAFRGVDACAFNFEVLRPQVGYIEDIQDIGELTRLLDETVELKNRTLILGMIRVRTEALLGKRTNLQDSVELYCVLPVNSEAERLVGARIVKLLREKVAEFSDFKSAYEALKSECGDMEFFHETLMRLIGEKFFPAP